MNEDAEDKIEEIPDIMKSRELKHAHEELVRRFIRVKAEYEGKFPDRELLITCTYRSPEQQLKLFKQGRFGDLRMIVTNVDGRNTKSRHNYFPSQAIDVAIIDSGKITWDESFYYPLGPISRNHNLEWGGFWTKFQDYPHLQLPKEDV